MRLLIDEEEVPWEEAWEVVCNTFFFTNHTVLPVRHLPFLVDDPKLIEHPFVGSFGGPLL